MVWTEKNVVTPFFQFALQYTFRVAWENQVRMKLDGHTTFWCVAGVILLNKDIIL